MNAKWMKTEERVRGHRGKARERKDMNSQISDGDVCEAPAMMNGSWSTSSTGAVGGESGRTIKVSGQERLAYCPGTPPGFWHQMIK